MKNSWNAMQQWFDRLKIPGVTYGAAALFLLFTLSTGKFLTITNILLIARHSSILILACIGMTQVILVSQVDLSIGSVMSLAGVITAAGLRSGLGIPLSILLGLASGLVIGLINGIMVAVFRFDYWISTFSTMGVCAGLALVFANGETIPVTDKQFAWLGNGKILGVYTIIYVTVFLVAVMMLVFRKTRFGYDVYSIGGSEQSARLSGINVTRLRIQTYLNSSLFAAIAGIMLASVGNSGSPIAGADYSFDAIAAVIIGGTAFDGGKGGLFGTVIGALMLRILASGLNLRGFPATWQKAIIGLTIVMILVADALNEKRKRKHDLRRRFSYEE